MFNLFGNKTAPMTCADAIAKAAAGELTLLDCREVAEVSASGTAAGAVHIPLALVPLKADPKAPDHDARLDPAKPVAVFCAMGGRAGRAAEVLRDLGYEAHNIGGFGDWCAAGGPVTR